jgi:hypothetical protein
MTIRVNDYFTGSGAVSDTEFQEGQFVTATPPADTWQITSPVGTIHPYVHRGALGLVVKAGYDPSASAPETVHSSRGIGDAYSEFSITWGDVGQTVEVAEAVSVGRGSFLVEFNSPAYGGSFVCSVRVDLGQAERKAVFQGATTGSQTFSGSVADPGASGENTIRVEFSNQLIEVYVNAVLVAATTDGNRVPYANSRILDAGWRLDSAALSYPIAADFLTLKRITLMQDGDTLGPPAPPPAFWTDFQRTREIP